MAQAIEKARQKKAEEETWPQLHYLWPQHPIMEWLGERVLTAFGRHRAPVLRSQHLSPDEQAFILTGVVPNRKGQPLLVDWQVACRQAESVAFSLEPFDSFIERARLKAGALPNSGQNVPVETLQASLPQAVQAMHAHMIAKQPMFAADMEARLRGTLAELEDLQGRQIQQLELQLEKVIEGVKRSRFERRSQHIHRVFDDYRQWVRGYPHDRASMKLNVEGGFYNPFFLKFNYSSAEPGVVQFGALLFELDPPCKTMSGHMIGYGPYSKSLVHGSILLRKEC